MNIWNVPAGWESWEHSHAEPPVTDNEHLLEPGVFARVGAAEKRRITTGAESAQILCIGATPGRAYEPLPIVELGGPESF